MTLYSQYASEPENQKLLNRAALAIKVTEAICERMLNQDVSRKDLAEKMGTQPHVIDWWLEGQVTLTLKQIADICTILDMTPEFSITGR